MSLGRVGAKVCAYVATSRQNQCEVGTLEVLGILGIGWFDLHLSISEFRSEEKRASGLLINNLLSHESWVSGFLHLFPHELKRRLNAPTHIHTASNKLSHLFRPISPLFTSFLSMLYVVVVAWQ